MVTHKKDKQSQWANLCSNFAFYYTLISDSYCHWACSFLRPAWEGQHLVKPLLRFRFKAVIRIFGTDLRSLSELHLHAKADRLSPCCQPDMTKCEQDYLSSWKNKLVIHLWKLWISVFRAIPRYLQTIWRPCSYSDWQITAKRIYTSAFPLENWALSHITGCCLLISLTAHISILFLNK